MFVMHLWLPALGLTGAVAAGATATGTLVRVPGGG